MAQKHLIEDSFGQKFILGDCYDILSRQPVGCNIIQDIQQQNKEKKTLILSEEKQLNQKIETFSKLERNLNDKLQILKHFNTTDKNINNNNTYLDLISQTLHLEGSGQYFKDNITPSNEFRVVYALQGTQSQKSILPHIINGSTPPRSSKDLENTKIGEKFLEDAIFKGATHVISEITYGFKVYMVFSKKNVSLEEKQQLEYKVKNELRKGYFQISGQDANGFQITNKDAVNNFAQEFEVEIFSDIPVEQDHNNIITIKSNKDSNEKPILNIKLVPIENFGGQTEASLKEFSDFDYKKILKTYEEFSQNHIQIVQESRDLMEILPTLNVEEDQLKDYKKDLRSYEDQSDSIYYSEFLDLLKKKISMFKQSSQKKQYFEFTEFRNLMEKQRDIQENQNEIKYQTDFEIISTIIEMKNQYNLKIIPPRPKKSAKEVLNQYLIKFLGLKRKFLVMAGEPEKLDVETQKCFKVFMENYKQKFESPQKFQPQKFDFIYLPQFDSSLASNREEITENIKIHSKKLDNPHSLNHMHSHRSNISNNPNNNSQNRKFNPCSLQLYDQQGNLQRSVYPDHQNNNEHLIVFQNGIAYQGQLDKALLNIPDETEIETFYLPSCRIQYQGTLKDQQFHGRGVLFSDNEDNSVEWRGAFQEGKRWPEPQIELPIFRDEQLNSRNFEDWRQELRISTLQDLKNNCENSCMSEYQGLSFIQFMNFFVFSNNESRFNLCNKCKLQLHQVNKNIAECQYELAVREYWDSNQQ